LGEQPLTKGPIPVQTDGTATVIGQSPSEITDVSVRDHGMSTSLAVGDQAMPRASNGGSNLTPFAVGIGTAAGSAAAGAAILAFTTKDGKKHNESVTITPVSALDLEKQSSAVQITAIPTPGLLLAQAEALEGVPQTSPVAAPRLGPCDCDAISLDKITPSKPTYETTKGDTTVTIKFKVQGTMKCTDGTHPNKCKGKLKWEFADDKKGGKEKPTWWATNQRDAKKGKVDPLPRSETENGEKPCTAGCGKTEPVSADFEYKVKLPGVQPINGEVKVKVTAECPNGKPPSPRTVTWVVDSTKGFDDDASDFDGDGLSGAKEKELKTDPNKQDTDGDGHSDGDEVAAGTNPRDAKSHP
jgi:hypothetical protein